MIKWLRDFFYPESPVAKTQTTIATNVAKTPERKTTTKAKKPTTKTTKTTSKKKPK